MASLNQQQESRIVIFNAVNSHLSCYGHKLAEIHLISYPDDSLVWIELGQAATKLSRYAEAESAFSNAISHADDNELRIMAYSASAEMYRRRGNLKKAEAIYRNAILIDSNVARNYVFAGITALRQGFIYRAAKTYRQGTAGKSNNEECVDECYSNLGSAMVIQERYQEGIECLEKAITLDPEYAWAKVRLRDARKALHLSSFPQKFQQKTEQESRLALHNAIDKNHYSHALVLAKLHLDSYSEDGITWIEFARTLTQLSRYKEAEEAFKNAWIYAHEILREIIYTEKAEMYFRQGKLASAEKYYRKAIELHPEHADNYAMAGKMAFYRGSWNVAEKIFRQGITCTGREREAVEDCYANLGLVMLARDRYADAIEYFEKALGMNPEYRWVKWRLRDTKKVCKFLKQNKE